MTRHIICIEGEQVVGYQYIMPGALTWGDEPLRVTWDFGHEDVIGTASDIRREDDGSITAEIVLLNEQSVPKDHSVSVYIRPVVYHSWKHHMWATFGEIKACAIVPFVLWKDR